MSETERLKSAIEILDRLKGELDWWFDANDTRQLNYINGKERYYVEEDDLDWSKP